MKKKTYVKPTAEQLLVVTEQLMVIASPGVGGEYNPSRPIGSKGTDFFEEEDNNEADIFAKPAPLGR